jgi:radical SAM protein with 4Fe4S-binding SPASM domain
VSKYDKTLVIMAHLFTYLKKGWDITRPNLHWILRYFAFYVKKGRFRNALNFLFATFCTKEEGIMAIFEPLYRKNPRLAPQPRRIELEATTKCCLKCVKCEQRYWHEEQKNMSHADYVKVMEQFPWLRAVSLTGIGHGFENPEYLDILRYAKRRGLYTQFFDTFFLLTEERAQEILRIGVDRIMVSMDGATAETYEKLQAGSRFERVLSNLRMMLNLKEKSRSMLPEISFVFVVMRENLKEMPLFLELLHEIFKKRQPVIWIQFIQVITFKENEDHKAFYDDYNKTVDETQKKAEALGGFRLSLVHSGAALPSFRRCTAWTVPFITVEGDVYPCCTFTEGNIRETMKTHNLGNVFKNDFRELWESEAYINFKKSFSCGNVPELCKNYSDCGLFNLTDECKETDSR